jgi:hypothetical protein
LRLSIEPWISGRDVFGRSAWGSGREVNRFWLWCTCGSGFARVLSRWFGLGRWGRFAGQKKQCDQHGRREALGCKGKSIAHIWLIGASQHFVTCMMCFPWALIVSSSRR